MAYCRFCGAALPEGARFCYLCGEKVDDAPRCPACGAALPEGSRFDVQQALYRMMGGEGELFTLYQPTRQENASVVGTGEGLTWVSRAEGGDGPSCLIYQVEVQGRQALYFDAFRDLSTRLTEPINDSFAIKVNGRSAAESYPAKRNDGLL